MSRLRSLGLPFKVGVDDVAEVAALRVASERMAAVGEYSKTLSSEFGLDIDPTIETLKTFTRAINCLVEIEFDLFGLGSREAMDSENLEQLEAGRERSERLLRRQSEIAKFLEFLKTSCRPNCVGMDQEGQQDDHARRLFDDDLTSTNGVEHKMGELAEEHTPQEFGPVQIPEIVGEPNKSFDEPILQSTSTEEKEPALNDSQEQIEPVIEVGDKIIYVELANPDVLITRTIVNGQYDPEAGTVGTHSPVALALLDLQEGEEAEILAPNKSTPIRVIKVEKLSISEPSNSNFPTVPEDNNSEDLANRMDRSPVSPEEVSAYENPNFSENTAGSVPSNILLQNETHDGVQPYKNWQNVHCLTRRPRQGHWCLPAR